MKVIFTDKRRETRIQIGNVIEIQDTYNERTRVWHLIFDDCTFRQFAQKDFEIYRIEI